MRKKTAGLTIVISLKQLGHRCGVPRDYLDLPSRNDNSLIYILTFGFLDLGIDDLASGPFLRTMLG